MSLSVVAAGLTAVVVFIISYLLFPVNGLEVAGNRVVPDSEIRQAVPDRASLPLLNSRNLERRLKTNPWVEDASVLKNWESGIVTVEVEEHRAVLDGNVEGRRVVISQDGTRLPGVGGTSLEEVRLDEGRLKGVREAIRTLENGGVELKSIDRVGSGGVHATVEGPEGRGESRVVFADGVGEGQVRVLRGLINQRPGAAYFDLRSPQRVVVGSDRDATGA